jgi:3-methyladenine DNA glycosylase AlkD
MGDTASSPPLFGVSYAALGKLRKKIKTDQALAVALWESGVHDARVLSCMVADPSCMTVAQLNAWVKELNNYVLTDALAGLAARSPHGESRMKVWIKSRTEWTCGAGWSILSGRAMSEEEIPESYFLPYLETIEKKIHAAPNRVRHSMNNALIAIGVRSEALAKRATEKALRIGKVTVDHGETSCKTPDAAAYIKKTRAHYAAKGKPKRGRHKGAC